MHKTENNTRYYSSFSGYKIPFQPSNELSEEAAKQLRTYYIATYSGKYLVSFEKIMDGERFFGDEYTYWPKSKYLQHRKMTKADASITEQDFDRKGNIIIPE